MKENIEKTHAQTKPWSKAWFLGKDFQYFLRKRNLQGILVGV